MYNVVTLVDKVRVPPELLKMSKENAIREIIRREYENQIKKDIGYVITLLDIKANSKGIVVPGDPNVYFDTECKLLTFSLEVNEIVTGIIKEVVDFGAFVHIGPFEAVLHISQIGKERFTFNKKTKQLISSDGKKVLKKGDIIYAKVSSVSMKGNVGEVKISLTTRDIGLGKLEWLKEEKDSKKQKEDKKGGKK